MDFWRISWFQAPWFIQKNTYKSTTFHRKHVCSSINFEVSKGVSKIAPPQISRSKRTRSHKQLGLFRNSPFPRETNHTRKILKKKKTITNVGGFESTNYQGDLANLAYGELYYGNCRVSKVVFKKIRRHLKIPGRPTKFLTVLDSFMGWRLLRKIGSAQVMWRELRCWVFLMRILSVYSPEN